LATPVFTPPAGSYKNDQVVTLSTPTSANATIYYTVNGTTPTTSSAVFSIDKPISVNGSETIKAIAKVKGYAAPSAVGTGAYTIAGQAAEPTFSPVAGTYTGTQSVVIGTATPKATIFYTTDGTNPATSATKVKFTAAVSVTKTETLHAVAEATGYTNSAEATAAYTIKLPVAAKPTFNPVAGNYTGTQSVVIGTTTPKATIYYTTDGTNPATSKTAVKYAAAVSVAKTETLNAVAEETGYTNSAEGTAAYTIKAPVAVKPTFSPVAGTYTGTQPVVIGTTTPKATIYYTTDGTNPATSKTAVKYAAAVSVAKTETLNAVAEESGYTNSAEATAAYTIKLPVAAKPTFSPAAGTYTKAQTVVIGSTTPKAVVYYTTDGTNPATSATAVKYTAAVSVAKTETINAVAKETGYANSDQSSATYTIHLANAKAAPAGQ